MFKLLDITYYFFVGLLAFFTGCAPLLGIKSYKSGDTEIQFITGYDFGLSANGIDQVENKRGIEPNGKGVKY